MACKLLFYAILISQVLVNVHAEDNKQLRELIKRLLEDFDPKTIAGKAVKRTQDQDREQAAQNVYEKYKIALEEWERKERHTKEAFATAFAAGEKLKRFVSDEADGGVSASDLLSEQIKAVRSCYVAGNGLVVSQTERKHFLENNLNIESQWDPLGLLDAEECQELDKIVSKMHYRSEVAFASWEVIADAFITAMKRFTDDMYIIWEDCLDKELEKVNQGEEYVALKCEHEIAYDGLSIVNHLKILHGILLSVGGEYDNALKEYKEGINSITNPCMAIEDFVEEIKQLEVISQVRKENEELLEKMNEGYIQVFSQWLALV